MLFANTDVFHRICFANIIEKDLFCKHSCLPKNLLLRWVWSVPWNCGLQGQNGDDQVPLCFRYMISPLESGKTHMFKPNSFDCESPIPTHRTFGALYHLNYDKVVKNGRASVLWEAWFSKKLVSRQVLGLFLDQS